MYENQLRAALRELPLGGFRFYKVIGSTNDAAQAWAAEGARDQSLVVADAQTSGRGRGGSTWLTPPGSGLAFSLVLRPQGEEMMHLNCFSALGALAVTDACTNLGLASTIKWPNDILLDQRKVGGILTEVAWLGESVDSVVLGIGVNVSADSLLIPERLAFHATSLEAAAERQLDRACLLREVLSALLEWRLRMGTQKFLDTWEQRLAFRGEIVEVQGETLTMCEGRISGLEPDGSLRLQGEDGNSFTVQAGEVHLRPVL